MERWQPDGQLRLDLLGAGGIAANTRNRGR